MTTKPLPPHGTLHRRKSYACTCGPCKAADRTYTNSRTRLMAYGQWQPYTDAEPVRAHVRKLMAQGIGWQQVAAVSGVSTGAISRLLYGDRRHGRPPTRRVRSTTASRIYSVQADLDSVADAARVDSTGVRRRLQALAFMGWPQLQLAQHLGISQKVIWQQMHSTTPVAGATARAVRDLYSRLWNVAPSTRGVAPRYVKAAQEAAVRKGWAPPGAWDDETIDDPTRGPDTGEESELNRTELAAYRRQEIAHLASFGIPEQDIAARLGISDSTVQQQIRDMRKAA